MTRPDIRIMRKQAEADYFRSKIGQFDVAIRDIMKSKVHKVPATYGPLAFDIDPYSAQLVNEVIDKHERYPKATDTFPLSTLDATYCMQGIFILDAARLDYESVNEDFDADPTWRITLTHATAEAN